MKKIISTTFLALTLFVGLYAALANPLYAAYATPGACSSTSDSFNITAGGTNTRTIVKSIVCLLEDSVVPLLFALAVAIFIWGTVKFIATNDSAEKEQGRQFMIWGIVALAIMFCMWGLVNLFNVTFGVQSTIPQLPSSQ